MRRWLSGWRAAVLATVLLALGLGIMHPEIALRGKVYASSDAQAAAAFQVVGSRALEAGEYPLWNPFVFAGMPSYGSLAYNPNVYPLSIPIRWLQEGLGAPPMTWLLLHLLLAGAGITGYLRWRCVGWPSAVGGGLLIMAMPNLLAWAAYGHGTKVGTFAWIPWALWCAEALLRSGRVPWAAGLGLFVALQLLRGHVQVAYYGVLAIGIYVLFGLLPELRTAAARATAGRRFGLVLLAGLLALGASAVLYLPVLEYQEHSIRGSASQGGGAAYDYATNWSLAPDELPTLWWPTAAGYGRASYVGSMPFTDYPNYVGLPLLALAVLGLVLSRDRWSWALATLAILSTLIALGRHSFVYDLFYQLAPGFKKFRVPVMILILQQTSLVLLGMIGLDRLLRMLHGGSDRRPGWLSRPLLVVVLALGLVSLLLGTLGASTLRETLLQRWDDLARAHGRSMPPVEAALRAADLGVADAWRLGLVFVLGVLICTALARRRLGLIGAGASIVVLLWIDLIAVGRPVLHPEKHLSTLARQGDRLVAIESEPLLRDRSVLKQYVEETPSGRWLKRQALRPRVWPLGPRATDNLLASQGIVSLGGYHAAKLKVYEDLRSRLYDATRPRVELANLLAARWALAPQPLGPGSLETLRQWGVDLGSGPVFRADDGVVYENRSALPRAWMVADVELESPGQDVTDREPDESNLARLLRPDFDPRRTVLLSAEPGTKTDPACQGAEIELLGEGTNWLNYRVRTAAPGVLVMADIWYPEWSVHVDGERERLLRANHALRAVVLEEGEHEIQLAYAGSSLRRGLWITILCSLALLAGLLLGPWQSIRGRANGSTVEESP